MGWPARKVLDRAGGERKNGGAFLLDDRARAPTKPTRTPRLPHPPHPHPPHPPLSLSLTHTKVELPPHLAHLPKSCAPAVATEYAYLVAAPLGDCHQPLLCSQAHGPAFKSVEAKLSKIYHTTIVGGGTFDAISVWADSSSVSMGGLSTYFRVQGAAARADAAKIADFINCTGGCVQKIDENVTPPTHVWSCSQHSDLVHVLAASLAMTKVTLDTFDEAYKMCCDASFAAGAAFCSAAALAQMEVARSKASLLATAKACVGDLAGQKELDRCLAKEGNFLAAAAAAESCLPLRYLVGAPVRERAAQVQEAGRPYMAAACETPVLSHSVMG